MHNIPNVYCLNLTTSNATNEHNTLLERSYCVICFQLKHARRNFGGFRVLRECTVAYCTWRPLAKNQIQCVQIHECCIKVC